VPCWYWLWIFSPVPSLSAAGHSVVNHLQLQLAFLLKLLFFSSRYFNFFSVDLILSFNCAAFAFICEGRFQGDLLQVPELETCRGG